MTPVSPQAVSLQAASVPAGSFMEQLINFLMPFFLVAPDACPAMVADSRAEIIAEAETIAEARAEIIAEARAEIIAEARAEIIATLASYGARTRREYLHAAQIIAFGLSALDALSEAKVAEMSPSMRLRCRGCANGLDRACQRNEKALARLQAAEGPNAADPAGEPLNDLSEKDLREILGQAQAQIDPTLNRLSNAHATAYSHKSSAIFDALFEAATPPRPAAA
jgi:hypothetical protein